MQPSLQTGFVTTDNEDTQEKRNKNIYADGSGNGGSGSPPSGAVRVDEGVWKGVCGSLKRQS